MSDIAAVILAAGEARRFRAAAGAAGPATKLVAIYQGEPLVRRVAAAALASRAQPAIVVTGHARAEVEAALAGLPVRFTHNPHFAWGLSTSLKAAVAALPSDAAGALVLLGDMPRVSPALLDRLIDAWAANPDVKAVTPTFDGRRGNPVLITRALFDAVAALEGDVGARRLLEAAGESVVEIAIDDAAIVFDVDTPDLLED